MLPTREEVGIAKTVSVTGEEWSVFLIGNRDYELEYRSFDGISVHPVDYERLKRDLLWSLSETVNNERYIDTAYPAGMQINIQARDADPRILNKLWGRILQLARDAYIEESDLLPENFRVDYVDVSYPEMGNIRHVIPRPQKPRV